MMARVHLLARYLVAGLLLLFLATDLQAQAQSARAPVAAQADAARVPPPGDDDPTTPPFDAAAPVSQSVPGTMTAGGVYTVTINMKNTGNTTWTSGAAYNLGSRNPMDNWTWGGTRVGIPGEIPPGGFAQFTFQVTAPAAPGSYNFEWGMVHDGVAWFGTPSANVVVNVTAPPRVNNASIVGMNVPSTMTAGQNYPATIIVQNTGNTTWTSSELYSLGNPLVGGVQYWNGGRVPLPGSIAPGQQAAFYFTVTAPPGAGTYPFNFLMVQDGVEFFGQSSNLYVNVIASPFNGAQVVGIAVPPLTPGQVANISVTLQNTGNTTWPAGSNYKLGSKNPDENLIWGVQRVDLASDVAPGQQYTFTFPVTAPAAGSYTMQWQMMLRYVEWFGGIASTPVTIGAAGDTVTYIHTDVLGSPVARSDSAGNVVSRSRYEPYGGNAGGVEPTIGFTGHVNDADTGLVYMQQRYYDPVAGRFLSVDPVTTNEETGSSFNRYAYASNNPFKYVDPDGRQIVIIVGKRERPDPFAEPFLPSAQKPVGDPISRWVAKQIFGNDTSTPPPDDDHEKWAPKPVRRVTNPKHHPNSQSPEPKNAQELFDKARVDKNGVRWSADENGNIHRFSKESNGESHWNGSTAGPDPIKEQNIPAEIRRVYWR